MNNELFLAYKCATDNFNCDCPQCDNDYFEIDYKSGHGHFKILRFNLICKFTLTDFKKVKRRQCRTGKSRKFTHFIC